MNIREMKPRTLERLISVGLIVLVLSVFSQVAGHDFINFDDGFYVTLNDHVQAGLTWKSFKWAFTTMHSANWHPLTWLSHMIDCQIYGLHPSGHHLTNLFFHVANTLLLFLWLREATGSLWKSFMVAGLFAIHPLHVESVAWVSERKDVLSAFFWMLTLLFYIRYSRKPGLARYLLTLATFALGLMAKPMLVTLPFVLLLMDFWPLGRISFFPHKNGKSTIKSLLPLIWEKIPLFVLSVASSVVTYMAQSEGGAVSSFALVPLKIRITNCLVAYVMYLKKIFWPYDLAAFYPHLGGNLSIWKGICAGAFLGAISLLVVREARRRPFLPVGWFWFLGTLFPVIGIIQVGGQSMADRYTYLPAIGIFVMIVWGVSVLLKGISYRRSILGCFSIVTLSLLWVITYAQVEHWKSTRTVFQHALSATEGNYLAHCMMAQVLSSEGNSEAGIEECKKALSIWPGYSDGHHRFGNILADEGFFDEAISHYKEALKSNPSHVWAHISLGKALAKAGKKRDAAEHYSAAERVMDDNSWTHNMLGIAWAEMGRFEESIHHFSKALELSPNKPETHNNIGRTLLMQGKLVEAISHLESAIRIKPAFPKALNNLGLALAQRGYLGEAIYSFSAALHYCPGYEKARTNLLRTVKIMCGITENPVPPCP